MKTKQIRLQKHHWIALFLLAALVALLLFLWSHPIHGWLQTMLLMDAHGR